MKLYNHERFTMIFTYSSWFHHIYHISPMYQDDQQTTLNMVKPVLHPHSCFSLPQFPARPLFLLLRFLHQSRSMAQGKPCVTLAWWLQPTLISRINIVFHTYVMVISRLFLLTKNIYIYPMDPSTFLGRVWDIIGGLSTFSILLRHCLDPQR